MKPKSLRNIAHNLIYSYFFDDIEDMLVLNKVWIDYDKHITIKNSINFYEKFVRCFMIFRENQITIFWRNTCLRIRYL